jgi:hypothetical protein
LNTWCGTLREGCKGNEYLAKVCGLPLWNPNFSHTPSYRGGYFDDGLVRLYLHHRLIELDGIVRFD